MEKKSLVGKKNVPASKSNSQRVDLSKPAPVRVELCRASGDKRVKDM
jgi:hypothetical protein